MPLRGKILNTWEVDSQEILASQEVHDISVAIGVDPVRSVTLLSLCVITKFVFWQMPILMGCI